MRIRNLKIAFDIFNSINQTKQWIDFLGQNKTKRYLSANFRAAEHLFVQLISQHLFFILGQCKYCTASH